MLRFSKLDGCGHPRRISKTQVPNRRQYVFLVAYLLLSTNAASLFLSIFGGHLDLPAQMGNLDFS